MMRKLFTFLVPMTIGILLTVTTGAQTPQKMSYQAVIRNSSDALVANTQIGIEINIRQGSQTGTVVYTETQTPTTNANGLVSIEIGGGAGFSTINWASDNYIETKTAVVAPLTTYTITGVSQLLSVPYALNAKTAENGITTAQANAITANTAKVGITPAQTTKLTGIAEGAEVNVNADWNATSGDAQILNKPTIPAAADGSETKIKAGTNVTITGSGTPASPYIVNATGSSALAIGDSYQGGIIFWLDATGQHGLIAATTDQSSGISWNIYYVIATGATGDGLYAGEMNTAMLVVAHMEGNRNYNANGNFAAKVCADYSVTVSDITYGDWYLPSKYELNLLIAQKTVVGGFASASYWSSTEKDSGIVWIQDAVDSSQGKPWGGNGTCYVRAIRAF